MTMQQNQYFVPREKIRHVIAVVFLLYAATIGHCDALSLSKRTFAYRSIKRLASESTIVQARKMDTTHNDAPAVEYNNNGGGNSDGLNHDRPRRRRDLLRAAVAGGFSLVGSSNAAHATGNLDGVSQQKSKRAYFQRFPTLFAPLYGDATRETIKKPLISSDNDDNHNCNIWALEQNLELGPLETPLRCVVVRLDDGTLWVHAPLAPTEEFFELVEACAKNNGGSSNPADLIAHVVVPTYALEHKVFVKDALQRWPKAKLWTAPGQFSFPKRSVSDEFVWGKSVSGVLTGSDEMVSSSQIPWIDEIQYETLVVGTFNLLSKPTTFYETAFFHKSSKTLIVTDSVAQVPLKVPALNDPQKLLLVSKRSTVDPMPTDTPDMRQIGWEKTCLLVSYFFPEHEELDPESGFGVVTWTEGWHDNFSALAGRLIVPPVVRTLLYAQNPKEVQMWVRRVVDRWDLQQIVPAHFEAPIRANRQEFERAFRFLDDNTIDAFPINDLARGLKPIADIALK